MSSVGVKETKDIVVTVAKFADAAGQAFEDGKISIFDLVHLYGPLMSLNAAVQGADQVPTELAALDVDGVEELKKTFKDEFSIPEAGLEAAVNSAVDVATQLLELALAIKNGKAAAAAAPKA